MNKFKAGDKVYFPQEGHSIFTVEFYRENTPYPIVVYLTSKFVDIFTEDGRLWEGDKAAAIFHATPENQRLLEQLHGIKLEDAPAIPTDKAITE